MKKFISALALVVALSGTAHAQDFQKGYDAYQAGDYATALQEWRPLADQGDADAKHNLGLMYENGQGVPQDYAEAVSWYRKAAEQGHAYAQSNIGLMYVSGQGVPQDYAEAVRWYRKAAEQGTVQAQYSLALGYKYGVGVLQDNILAHMWFNIGGANGSELGSENRDLIAKEMTPQDISTAQAMARTCMSSNYQKCG